MSIGRTPEARANTSTTIKFSPRLNSAPSTIDSGMTMRGNWIFRTSASRSSTLLTEPPVASLKNVNSTIDASSCIP